MKRKKNSSIKRRMVGAYISSILSISLVLVLVGVSTLLLTSAQSVADYFKENLLVSVMLKQSATEEQGRAYARELESRPYVSSVTFIDREQGTKELKEMLGEDFLDVFQSSPVPISVDINLKAEYVSSDSLELVKSLLEKDPLTDEVESQKNLVEALSTNMRKVTMLLAVFMALLLFISLILINNVVRLHIFDRRFSIKTMQLVGATRGFIRKPFLIRAVFQGLASAIVALMLIAGLLWFVHSSLPQLFEVMTMEIFEMTAGAVVLCGVVICVAGTFFDVNKLLSMSKEEIYG